LLGIRYTSPVVRLKQLLFFVTSFSTRYHKGWTTLFYTNIVFK